jgi:CubicO group peptidase (beta-lactamase class C family)
LTWAADLPTADPQSLGFSSERLARIGPAIQREIETGQYPGAVMLVARNGRIVYFESVGQLDPASGKPMTKDAIFRLYSMTKPYTSVAIMMLMEEGKLRVTDPVSKYIPAFANLQVSVEGTDPYTGATKYVNVPVDREISIQDLLRHTSGMVSASFTAHPKVKELYTKEGVDWKDVTPAEQIERLAKVPLAHQPGTTFEYGLSTDAGRIVEVRMTLESSCKTLIYAARHGRFCVRRARTSSAARHSLRDRSCNQYPIKLLDVTVAQKNYAGGGVALELRRITPASCRC